MEYIFFSSLDLYLNISVKNQILTDQVCTFVHIPFSWGRIIRQIVVLLIWGGKKVQHFSVYFLQIGQDKYNLFLRVWLLSLIWFSSMSFHANLLTGQLCLQSANWEEAPLLRAIPFLARTADFTGNILSQCFRPRWRKWEDLNWVIILIQLKWKCLLPCQGLSNLLLDTGTFSMEHICVEFNSGNHRSV